MRLSTAKTAALVTAIVFGLVLGARLASRAESNPNRRAAGIDTGETTETKIARAMSAGPPEIARSAKIIDKDAQGHIVVLREGSNGFTCMPGKLVVVGVSDEPIEVNLIQLLLGTKSIVTEVGGTPIDKEDTLRFSALQDVRPMLERRPLERASKAYARMMKNEARFRMVLTM